MVILSIRVTSLKMLLGQGGSHGVGDHILMVLQCQGQGDTLVISSTIVDSLEVLGQGGRHTCGK